MSTPSVSAPRQKSARIATKSALRRRDPTTGNSEGSAGGHHHRGAYHGVPQQPVDLYPGLNDLSDFLEAFPLEVIRHFTLLREVEAKCTTSTSLLATLIPQFLAMDVSDPARVPLLAEVQRVIAELLPCFEEKIHVAGSASEAVARHMERLDEDFDRISRTTVVGNSVIPSEIPESVIFGPANHPALIGDGGRNDEAKQPSQASTRSESRREAIVAKKAAAAAAAQQQHADGDMDVATGVSGSKKRSSVSANGSLHTGGSNGVKHGVDAIKGDADQQQQPPSKRRKANNGSSTATGGVNGSVNGNGTSSVSGTPSSAPLNSFSGAPGTVSGSLNGADAKSSGVGSMAAPGDFGRVPSPSVRAGTPSGQSRRNGGSGNGGGNSNNSGASRSGNSNSSSARNSVRRPHNSTHGAGSATTALAGTVVPLPVEELSPHNAGYNDTDSEPVYCYCQQVSFGEMVACDAPDCKREWFHLPCVGLSAPPKGQWFCNECAIKYGKKSKSRN
ncbi:uncharacterized protein V1518DRAFT_414125 [Limtongia smithiae]|uniref:uncharacterized protein n=1 Tax=Limtongia smithiae TaxID=1125753 RepID=UPI0034CE9439